MSSRTLPKRFSGSVRKGQAIDSAGLTGILSDKGWRSRRLKAYVLGERWRLARRAWSSEREMGGGDIKRLVADLWIEYDEIAKATR
jgi:hypothetical protein